MCHSEARSRGRHCKGRADGGDVRCLASSFTPARMRGPLLAQPTPCLLHAGPPRPSPTLGKTPPFLEKTQQKPPVSHQSALRLHMPSQNQNDSAQHKESATILTHLYLYTTSPAVTKQPVPQAVPCAGGGATSAATIRTTRRSDTPSVRNYH